MNDIGVALAAIGLGLTLLMTYRASERKRRRHRGRDYDVMGIEQEPLVILQRENPDLPAVPSTTASYEVWEIWFQEALKRVVLRTTRRTREESLKLNEQILQYQLQCLTYHQNKAKIREVTKLADLEFEAKRHGLLFQIEESKAKMEALRRPPESPKSEDAEKLRTARQKRVFDARYAAGEKMHKVRERDELKRFKDELLEEARDNPTLSKDELADRIEFILDQYRQADDALKKGSKRDIYEG